MRKRHRLNAYGLLEGKFSSPLVSGFDSWLICVEFCDDLVGSKLNG
jgi:hypothetical protein